MSGESHPGLLAWFGLGGHSCPSVLQLVFNRTVTLKEDPGKV